jgi:hypothetical protein
MPPSPPDAPLTDYEYSDTDYKIAEFEDLNDGDIIYVRWSVAHQQAYMYSDLDRPTQWVLPHWTIRRTIEIGLGMNRDGEWFNVDSNLVIIHRERPDQAGDPQMETLDPDNDADWVKIEDILKQTWNSYGGNKIMVMFSVR